MFLNTIIYFESNFVHVVSATLPLRSCLYKDMAVGVLFQNEHYLHGWGRNIVIKLNERLFLHSSCDMLTQNSSLFKTVWNSKLIT